MATDNLIEAAIDAGINQAVTVLKFRNEALAKRKAVVQANIDKMQLIKPAPPGQNSTIESPVSIPLAKDADRESVGVLVAEGDSWFDYPFHDILRILEDDYGYEVEAVAHKGDSIEEMAYGGGQLEELTRHIEKILRRGMTSPLAILLSGGGNDIAGNEFGVLLNHMDSAAAGLNTKIVEGIIDERIRYAYITLISAITEVCMHKLGKALPILIHGYDHPVPDGRGFWGGFKLLPGPWLEPGFRKKGFDKLTERILLAEELIDRLNAMLEEVASLGRFSHVHYIDLRNTLSNGGDYQDLWENELHPSKAGFERVTKRFADIIQTLP
ncbi:conserved hypothetical protein [Candidatus Methylobacter favarea]|uniref:SGNH hydrolase-type esterase domain-containing protein n=1 Tax=Candidatus Methylobacter favarea TaxID=2707345 RepID=A0A8S0XHR4_9GAMM|nr:SGNH/GDSL hydrolase family protein [Candidatus Methylobacter favarea]CAA9892043.1 conserved hypothetical protein [Candidatus Methylobacter favarea]